MSNSSVAKSEWIVKPAAPAPLKTRVIELGGKRYEVASVTEQCHTITALHTGAVRQFRNLDDLWAFVEALTAHLERQAAQERAA